MRVEVYTLVMSNAHYYFHWAVIHNICAQGFNKIGEPALACHHAQLAIYFIAKGLEALALQAHEQSN